LKIEEHVYKKLLHVPSGHVITYQELANAVGLHNRQRMIDRIMKNNPFPIIVPCHRVVKSDGKIGGYAFGEKIKKNMLQNEGIEIHGKKL
tara:strand:+ start:383 stop:652 length:270 start_codon:yes stop_codon:yes gene_type:complete